MWVYFLVSKYYWKSRSGLENKLENLSINSSPSVFAKKKKKKVLLSSQRRRGFLFSSALPCSVPGRMVYWT